MFVDCFFYSLRMPVPIHSSLYKQQHNSNLNGHSSPFFCPNGIKCRDDCIQLDDMWWSPHCRNSFDETNCHDFLHHFNESFIQLMNVSFLLLQLTVPHPAAYMAANCKEANQKYVFVILSSNIFFYFPIFFKDYRFFLIFKWVYYKSFIDQTLILINTLTLIGSKYK